GDSGPGLQLSDHAPPPSRRKFGGALPAAPRGRGCAGQVAYPRRARAAATRLDGPPCGRAADSVVPRSPTVGAIGACMEALRQNVDAQASLQLARVCPQSLPRRLTSQESVTVTTVLVSLCEIRMLMGVYSNKRYVCVLCVRLAGMSQP